VREVKKRKERRKVPSAIIPSSRRGAFAALGVFLAGLSIGLPAYLYSVSLSRRRAVLSVVVPSLPSGGTGFVYVSGKGGAFPPGRSVRAHLDIPGVSAESAFDESGIAVLALRLESVAPGRAVLTVRTGEFKVVRPVVIEPSERLTLWAGVRRRGDVMGISSLLRVSSFVTGAPLEREPVSFRLFDPEGEPLSKVDLRTDENGFASYTLNLKVPDSAWARPRVRRRRSSAPDLYRLVAATGGASVAASFSLRETARGRSGREEELPRVIPEGGVLVAGVENRCLLEGGAPGLFPLEIEIEREKAGKAGPFLRTRVEKGSSGFGFTPPANAAALLLTVRSLGAEGERIERREHLSVRGTGSILCRPSKRRLEAGETTTVRLLRAAEGPCAYVLELLSGKAPVKTLVGAISGREKEVRVELPSELEGEFFLRAWPLEGNAALLFTATRLSVRNRKENLFEIVPGENDSFQVRNVDPQNPLAFYSLAGEKEPETYTNSPPSLTSLPFQASLSAPDPAASAAPLYCRFWSAFILFAASVPLLRGFAVLFRDTRKKGLFGLIALTLVLYLVTTLNHRLFGTAVLAAGLFWIHRVYGRTYRILSPTERLALRWAVPVLCLAPYIQLAHPTNSPPVHAGPSTQDALTPVPIRPEGPPPAPPLIKPGESRALAFPFSRGRFLFCAARSTGEMQLEVVPFRKRPNLEVDLRLPERLTWEKEGDRLFVPLTMKNESEKPWKGSVWVEGEKGLLCEGLRYFRGMTIAPGERWVTELNLRTASPGEGALKVSWSGTAGGSREFATEILPAGVKRSETWNAVTRKGEGTEFFEALLPAGCLYRATALRARVFPGPLSQMLKLMEVSPESAWSEAERALAAAHAACLALRHLRYAEEDPEIEEQTRNRLASGILKLLEYRKVDGSFCCSPHLDPTGFTAQAALFFEDQESAWRLGHSSLLKARRFLRTQVRADGTFRKGPLRKEPSRSEIFATCLVACALADLAPDSTRAFIARRLGDDAGDAALRAALLAAAKATGAIPAEEVLAAVRALERMPAPSRKAPEAELAWWAYGLSACGASPERAQSALAALSLHRNREGVLSTVLANQLLLRSVFLSARKGPRLTANTFRFIVNGHPREKLELDRSSPDVPYDVDLTAALHMEKNTIRVDTTGSPLTPYQVVLSYALPWRAGDTEKAPVEIGLEVPPGIKRKESTFRAALRLKNRTGKTLNGLRALFRIPPAAELSWAYPILLPGRKRRFQ